VDRGPCSLDRNCHAWRGSPLDVSSRRQVLDLVQSQLEQLTNASRDWTAWLHEPNLQVILNNMYGFSGSRLKFGMNHIVSDMQLTPPPTSCSSL
jgi:hypothetical protein